jgi:hypothetical protein
MRLYPNPQGGAELRFGRKFITSEHAGELFIVDRLHQIA